MVMPDTSPKRILVVDDDPLFIKSLCNILRTDGYQVVASDGGQAGIDAFQSALTGGEPFDVVITDLSMRVVDGREVAAAIKSASPSTPVILMTGWGQSFEQPGDAPLTVDYIMDKPPKLRQLREALARWLKPPNT